MDFFLLFSISIILFGYGAYVLILTKKLKTNIPDPDFWPEVSFIIPAYNEEDFLAEKIKNTLACDYPADRLEIIVAADGSTDNSKELVESLGIRYENNGARLGKGMAMNRAKTYAKNEILIFSDANAMLNTVAIKEIVKPLLNPEYGMSSGEKKVISKSDAENASAGEGVYWKYESYLKQRDSDFYTLVAAVGELFGIKKANYRDIPANFLLDDFFQTASVLEQGYKIKYTPKALATEYGSLNFVEEIKRKVRIAAGGYQSMLHFKGLFNPLKNWKITYLFVAHRVLRWTIIPVLYFALPIYLVYRAAETTHWFYLLASSVYLVYLMAAAIGLYLNKSGKKAPFIFNIPFYITLMNYCALAGGVKYFTGIKSGAWEKVKRA